MAAGTPLRGAHALHVRKIWENIMLEFKIEPHIGVGPVKLGENRNVLRDILREYGLQASHSTARSDYFEGVQVEYTDDHASFIGLSFSKVILFTYDGINVFDIEAERLFRIFSGIDKTKNHFFNKYEYLFPELVVTLWDADEQYDRLNKERRQIWAQVGVGNDIYLSKVLKIRGE
jgi:hypothetical protein